MIKKIFSHSLIYGIAPQIPKLVGILILPFITPFLTKTDFGIYGIVTSYTIMFRMIKDLGLKVVFTTSFFKHNSHIKKIWGQLYGFLYLWNFVFAFLVVILLYFILPNEALENRWLIIALTVCPIIFFSQTMDIGQLYYQLKQKPLQVGIRSLIIGCLAVGVTFYTIAILKIGYMGFFWSSFISLMLYNVSYWIPLNFTEKIKPIFNFKWRFIKSSLKVGLPLIPHNVAGYLQATSDRVVMQNVGTPTTDIGSYSFAYNFSELFSTIATSVNRAVTPFMFKFYKNDNDLKARDIVFLWQILLNCLAFVFCLWLKEFFQILVKKDELAELYPIAIILIMAQLYRPMAAGGVKKLFYLEKTKVLFKVTLTAGVINVILNLVFIPIYGFEFAVFATYLTFLIQGYIFYGFRIFKEINQVKFYPIFWMLLQICLTIAVYLMKDLSLIHKIIISVIMISISSISIYKRRNI